MVSVSCVEQVYKKVITKLQPKKHLYSIKCIDQ